MVASHTDPSIPFSKASYRRMEGMAVCHNLFYFNSLYSFCLLYPFASLYQGSATVFSHLSQFCFTLAHALEA